MKKIGLFLLLSAVSLPALAEVYTAYPTVDFDTAWGKFSVPVTAVCHDPSGDLLRASVCLEPNVNGCAADLYPVSTPRTIPLIGKAPIVQTRAIGGPRGVGMQYFEIPECK